VPTCKRGSQDGFALVTALAAVAIFGFIAFAMLAAEKGNMAGVIAQGEQARLAAAADAGLVIAASHLSATGMGAQPWRIDGRAYALRYRDVALAIRIEDERGKIRLNDLSESQVRLMFESAGVTGRRVDDLTDAFLDWTDSDDEARPNGAEAAAYQRQGYRPRNGALTTVSELALIRGMDRTLYERLAPVSTVFFGGAGAFDPTTASPLAMAVMMESGMGSPEIIARQREMAGQRTALELGDRPPLGARPLTVRITAQLPDGAKLERATIIEFPDAVPGRWEIRYQP
jgi:general secretion pathway protein K